MAMHDSQARARSIRRVLGWILVANWAVAAAKLVFGVLGSSASLTADGLHSIIDGGSNVIALVAMAMAARPPDHDHPYGHGKFEALASLAIGVMVGAAAVGLGRMAYSSFRGDLLPHATVEMMVVTVITLLVNVAVSWSERRAGKRLNSPLLLADAQHTLSDVFVSLAVLTSLVLVRLGFRWADAVVATVVMVVVAVMAFRVVKEAVGGLVDAARLDPRRVVDALAGQPGVLAVRNVRSRGVGHQVFVDLVVEALKETSLGQAHQLADEVEAKLKVAFPDVADVVVHVEPAGVAK
jgi:cation diffusion facilitator family transporter